MSTARIGHRAVRGPVDYGQFNLNLNHHTSLVYGSYFTAKKNKVAFTYARTCESVPYTAAVMLMTKNAEAEQNHSNLQCPHYTNYGTCIEVSNKTYILDISHYEQEI